MAVCKLRARRPSSHRLPEAEEVWQRVAAYARDCLLNDRSVFTVTRSVENRITDVKDKSIGRVSAQGTTNASRVTRAMVESLWSELQGGQGGSSYLYFTKALLLAALPGIVEDMDGELVLRDDPRVLETKRRRMVIAHEGGEGTAGGEGETHRRLKKFIYSMPDVALASLNSGPYQRVAMEYVFPTGDRVDVVLIDGSGNVLLGGETFSPRRRSRSVCASSKIPGVVEHPQGKTHIGNPMPCRRPGYQCLSLEENKGRARRRMYCYPFGQRKSELRRKYIKTCRNGLQL